MGQAEAQGRIYSRVEDREVATGRRVAACEMIHLSRQPRCSSEFCHKTDVPGILLMEVDLEKESSGGDTLSWKERGGIHFWAYR
jgi:hypothetical protein